MSAQPEALRLADMLEKMPLGECDNQAAAELRRLHAQIAACEPYLKEGETPAERIERDHRDSLALMTLLAREKTKNEALLEALQSIADCCDEEHAARDYAPRQTEIRGIARAAIKAVEESK